MATVTPRDLLLPAGQPGELEVEVEQKIVTFVDPAVSGVEVSVEGVGSAKTGSDGIARIPLPAHEPGLFTFPVRSGAAPETNVLVRVIEKDSPVFITDLDKTIAHANAWSFVFRSNEAVRPFDGAAAALSEISKTQAIVYLTARDHLFIRKSKEWLRLHGFPEGPVYARKTRFWSAVSRTHKIARLAELRASFPNITWAVGDRKGDMEAYAAHGIPAILISKKPPGGLPPGTKTVPDWAALRDMIK